MTSRARLVTAACGGVAALYLIKGIYRGLSYTHGDFYNTLPGEYASRWNPTLWHSADIQPALAYNHGAYLYGPTQYLTLFPIVFLDSYASIASWLLAVYPVVLLAAVGVGLHLGWFYWIGVAAVGALLAYEHSLVKPGDLRRLDAAFFTVNGVISVVFFGFVLAEAAL